MGFFKIQCEITSCPYQEPSKNGGYCNKGIFDTCPQTTKPGNEKVKNYHKKRRERYKK